MDNNTISLLNSQLIITTTDMVINLQHHNQIELAQTLPRMLHRRATPSAWPVELQAYIMLLQLSRWEAHLVVAVRTPNGVVRSAGVLTLIAKTTIFSLISEVESAHKVKVAVGQVIRVLGSRQVYLATLRTKSHLSSQQIRQIMERQKGEAITTHLSVTIMHWLRWTTSFSTLTSVSSMVTFQPQV